LFTLRHLLLAACCTLLSSGALSAQRVPVLVELFTSEGCSSCPPADRLLERLDPQSIVLSEHVDYWDHLGWKDRFSSHQFTERQQAYVRQFALDGPYTPQMVVDGAAQFSGGDGRQAAAEIDKAARHPKAEIHLARTGPAVRVEISAAPHACDIWLAVADDVASSQVAAGENKGRELHHVAVVRSLRKIGSLKSGRTFASEVALPAGAAGQRVVVFLQEAGQAHVLGAAMLPGGGL
jgi:hypothetical protein